MYRVHDDNSDISEYDFVSLSNTKTTDADLKVINGLTNLLWLDLSETQVTDAGLKDLKGLAKLDYLNLSGTKVTNAGISDLREALPKLHIERQPAKP